MRVPTHQHHYRYSLPPPGCRGVVAATGCGSDSRMAAVWRQRAEGTAC